MSAHEVLSDLGSCPGCPSAAILAAAGGALSVCLTCRATYEPEAPTAPARASAGAIDSTRLPRTLRRTATDPHARLRAVVQELLTWHLACAQQERSQGSGYLPVGQQSSTAGVLRVLETGIVGSGCSGTKGVWTGGAPEPEAQRVLSVDARVGQRYSALGELREVADAVIADAQGDCVADVELYRTRGVPKVVRLGLAQRVGLALASVKQQARWRVKIVQGDSAPALEGMRADGERALGRLLVRWEEIAQQERAQERQAEARAEVMRGVRLEGER